MKAQPVALPRVLLVLMAGLSFPLDGFLFEDGTFETPIPSLTDGIGWEAFGTPDAGNAVSREDWANGAPGTGGAFGYAAPDDGQFGLAFRAFSASEGGFFHDVAVESGRQYAFHIQSHTASNFYDQVVASGSGSVKIVFEFYESDPTVGGDLVASISNDITSSITDGGSDGEFPSGPTRAGRWQDWDYTGLTAPAASAYLRVVMYWYSSDLVTGGDEVMRWDNAELTTTLDPLNASTTPTTVPRVSLKTQEEVSYTVERSKDPASGYVDAGLPTVNGNGVVQSRLLQPPGELEFFRLRATANPAEVEVSAAPFDEAGGDAGWLGFLNVFELPANGGAFVFGSVWGLDELVSTIASTSAGGATTFFLSPNAIEDPDDFWYQDTTGTAPDPTKPGGPGQAGNKSVEANLYIAHTDSNLSGKTVTFRGTVVANTLTPDHTAVAFIRDFAPDFSSNVSVTTPLSPGPFAITLVTDPGAGRQVQYGFQMIGPNVWVTDVAPFGSVEIAVESPPEFVFDETYAALDFAPTAKLGWDGQAGVHYFVEYSDDGGSNWFRLIPNAMIGDGSRTGVIDPAGVVPGRTFRVVTPPPVPRVPA